MDDIIFKEMYSLESYHWWFVARRKIISAAIKYLDLPSDSAILDAGCGNGDNLALLSGFGDVIAFEKDAEAIVRARSRKFGEVYKGDLPYNVPNNIDTNFDLIVLLDVLEHIDNDKESLVSVRNLMNDSGKLLITVPAFQWLWTNHDVHHHHKRRYSEADVMLLLHSSGFKIRYISYFNTLLFPLAIFERIIQKIFPPSEKKVLKMPNSWLNYSLEKIFSLEAYLINKTSLPFGLSIIAVADKNNP